MVIAKVAIPPRDAAGIEKAVCLVGWLVGWLVGSRPANTKHSLWELL